VIVTSDHGERIARNGVLGHSYTLHPDVSCVPLVCSGPSVPDRTVDSPISLKDLYGTILRSTGVTTDVPTLLSSDTHGRAFAEMAGADPDRIANLKGERYRSVAEQFDARSALWTTEGRAEIRHGSGEKIGPAQIIEELEGFLAQLERNITESTVSPPEQIAARLEHLGYR